MNNHITQIIPKLIDVILAKPISRIDHEERGVLQERLTIISNHDCDFDGHCTYCLQGREIAETLEQIDSQDKVAEQEMERGMIGV